MLVAGSSYDGQGSFFLFLFIYFSLNVKLYEITWILDWLVTEVSSMKIDC